MYLMAARPSSAAHRRMDHGRADEKYVGSANQRRLVAVPLAVGIAVGRIGCFLTGLADKTYGTPTTCLGNGLWRWCREAPDAAIRGCLFDRLSVFLYRLLPVRGAVGRIPMRELFAVLCRTAMFQVVHVSYLGFRAVLDFWKPSDQRCFWYGSLQWACLAAILIYSRDISDGPR